MWVKKTILIALFLCLGGSATSFADIVYENDYEGETVGGGFPAWNWGDNGTAHNAVYADYDGNIVVEHTGTIGNATTAARNMRFGSKWDITLSGNTSSDPADYFIAFDIRSVSGDWDPIDLEFFVLTKESGGDYGYGSGVSQYAQADGWLRVVANLADLTVGWWQGQDWDMTNPSWSIEVGGPPWPGTSIPAGTPEWDQIWLMDNLIITMGEEPPSPATGFATNPVPDDEETDVSRDVVLSWTPAIYAPPTSGHRIFFSENFNDVNDGVDGVIQDTNSYDPPGLLDWSTTYYWRVDEANNTTGWDQGEVWSFTVEPVGYPIPGEDIAATASSNDTNKGPQNTVNSSGLDESGLLHGDLGSDIWLSSLSGEQPTWIEYQFDKPYKLHEMWVWNSNESVEADLGFGFKDVLIQYSLDGTDYTTLGTTHEFARAPGEPNYAHDTTIPLEGVMAKYVKLTANSNWGGLLAKYGLSEVRFFYTPVMARLPNPEPGQTDVSLDATLSWRPGREAAEHDVYFSTDEQAVTDGTAPMETVTEARYDPPPLGLGETYYWRVDEANDLEDPDTWEGDVWNFTTEQFLVVDDFEIYDINDNQIWFLWKDGIGYDDPAHPPAYGGNGTGSAVGDVDTDSYTEETIVHGGGQSMPYWYANDGSTGKNLYSESELTLSPAQDWTKGGAKALSLWFYGDPGNDAGVTEQLYVKVNGAKVTYDGDLTDITEASWHEWNIDLADFGIGLTNVTTLAIGFGDEANTTPGGSGKVYFDDIRLYPAGCVPSRLKPAADLNDDCVVDYLDVEIMSQDWLLADDVIATTPVSATGLVGHWPLDGNANDISASGNNGTLNGEPVWTSEGQMGGALELDGDDDYVDLPIGSLISSLTDCSIATWVNWSGQGGAWQRIFDFGVDTLLADDNPTVYMFLTPSMGEAGGTRFAITTGSSGGESQLTAAELLPSGWHHVAVTIDGTSMEMVLYLDGVLADSGATATLPADLGQTEEPDQNWLGRSQWAWDPNFAGQLDDFRIYDRALSQAEVAYLADTTPDDGQLHVPVPSPAELHEAEPQGSRSVDLKDYAVLADAWLEEQLWPLP